MLKNKHFGGVPCSHSRLQRICQATRAGPRYRENGHLFRAKTWAQLKFGAIETPTFTIFMIFDLNPYQSCNIYERALPYIAMCSAGNYFAVISTRNALVCFWYPIFLKKIFPKALLG